MDTTPSPKAVFMSLGDYEQCIIDLCSTANRYRKWENTCQTGLLSCRVRVFRLRGDYVDTFYMTIKVRKRKTRRAVLYCRKTLNKKQYNTLKVYRLIPNMIQELTKLRYKMKQLIEEAEKQYQADIASMANSAR